MATNASPAEALTAKSRRSTFGSPARTSTTHFQLTRTLCLLCAVLAAGMPDAVVRGAQTPDLAGDRMSDLIPHGA
jgi:hypothetical protein